jgi:hypothetical protein
MGRTTAVFLGAFGVLLVIGSGCSSTDDTSINTAIIQVDGKTFNEKYTCNESFDGGPLSCVDLAVQDQIQFTLLSGNTYEARDVPDTGFLYTGTFNGLVFNWTATSPDGYTEAGSWTFGTSGNGFSGSSTYIADDLSYQGSCKETGSVVPNIPNDPPLVTACP